MINDHFFIDFETNESFKYSDIKSVTNEAKTVNIQTNDIKKTLYFATIEDSEKFYQKLQAKLQRRLK